MSRLELKVAGEQGQVKLRSFVTMLQNARLVLDDLDSAISSEPHGSLEWYVADLRYSSAVAVVESRPKSPKADDRLGELVSANFVSGLETLEGTEVLPPYFSDVDLGRVRRISNQVRKSGGETFEATHLNGGDHRSAVITEQAGVNVARLLRPRYQTIGSVTGNLELISVHDTPRFNVYETATKRAVRCKFDVERLDEVTAALGHRVTVAGIVYRNANGDPIRVEKPEIRVIGEGELPSARDLIGLVPDMTGDLSSEEYIRKLRDA